MNKIYFAMLIFSFLLFGCVGGKKIDESELTISGLNKKNFEAIVDGKQTDLYVLKNNAGMEVCITNYGGRIVSVLVPDKAGVMKDIVLGFDSIQDYINVPSDFGAAIGRYANRIDGGKFELDGIAYQLDRNNFGNTLHGGAKGFQYMVYDAKQPDNKTLLVKQLLLESQLGQISDADLASRLLPALQPLPSDAAELRSLGLGLAQLDPPNPALLSVYQSLLASNVDAPFLNFRVAQIFLQQNQLAEAKSALAAYKATASGANDLAPDLLLADIQRREGNLDASAQTYEALIARNQVGDDLLNGALRGLAGVRLAQGQRDQAIALYDQLLQRNPNDLRTALGRATIAYQAKRINQTEAEAVLKRWLSTEPATNTPPELINLVGTLPPSPERESLYTALLAVAPNDVPLQLRQLQVLAVRDPQGAKDRVAQLIARNPDNIGAYFVQGELAQNLGDLELAGLAYSGILAKQPNNTDALAALAGVRFQQRKFVAATELYNRILAINPKDLLARRALAELSLAQDQPFTALERFKQLQQEQLVSSSNPEFINRVQRLEVDILKRRGFQPYWERF